ncbi:MAG: MFS transporter, partial [Armatimonadia bacterium]
RLLITRSLSTITLGLTLPFIVPYALSQLRVPAAAVGLFVTSKIITYSLSNLLWSRVSDEGGNRRLLLLSGFMTIGALALVLSVRMLPTDHLVTIAGINVTWRVAFLCLIFAAFGFSNAGQEIGYTNFLLELIPERKRSVYMGIFYAAISPLCWVPFFGSLAIGTGGRFVMGFSIAAVLALAMMRYTFRLREVREFEGDGNGEN